jgi:hypothetical protein
MSIGGQLAGTLPAKHDDVALRSAAMRAMVSATGPSTTMGFMGDTGGVEQCPCRSEGVAATGFLHGFDFALRHVAEHFRRIDRRLYVEQHDLAGDAVLRQLDDMPGDALGMLGTIDRKQNSHGWAFVFCKARSLAHSSETTSTKPPCRGYRGPAGCYNPRTKTMGVGDGSFASQEQVLAARGPFAGAGRHAACGVRGAGD